MSASTENLKDFQEELKQYIEEHDLHDKFTAIVEALLIEKPENPIGFIVKYLLKKYPSETKDSIELEQEKVQTKLDDGNDQPKVVEPTKIEQSDESDSESDDSVKGEDNDGGNNDDDDVEKPVPVSVVKRTKRRVSVCAEKLCPIKMDAEQVKKIPKTEEEAARIQLILQKNVLFQHLDQIQLQNVQDAMFLVEHADDDVIIKQGDDGDNFYLIDQGSVDVFIKNEDDGDSKQVASYTDGDSFGELAIMYNSPRAATCIAKSGNVRLWAIDRVSFKVIMMQTAITKRNIHKGFLKNVPILSELTEYEILTIADALQEDTFEDGEVICNEHDSGNRFYIIKEGSAVCSKAVTDAEGNVSNNEVARLTNGAYFGEIALITSKPRQATVSASGKLTCLSLERKTFKRVMGCLQEIMMRNMEAYNRFQAANI